jgi:uncharacterized protein YoaH (UPF0181 family)
VPDEYHDRIGQIQDALDRLPDEDPARDNAIAAVAQDVRAYTTEVEAFIRKVDKHGGTYKPTGDEIQMLQYHVQRRTAEALEGILDLLRHGVSTGSQRFAVVLTSSRFRRSRPSISKRQIPSLLLLVAAPSLPVLAPIAPPPMTLWTTSP